MKTLLTILLLVGNAIFAQIPSKLDDLKAKKDAAIKRIEDVYKDELKKLLADPFIKGDPGKLGEVLKELGQDIVETTIDDKFWFIGKTWLTSSGTKFIFDKSKRCTRIFSKDKTKLTWEYSKIAGVIVVKGDFGDSGKTKEKYFNFSDKDKPLYGNDISDMRAITHE